MVLSFSDLESNLYFNEFARDIVVDVLAKNDKALVMNLLDKSRKVIIDVESFRHLLKLIFEDETVVITTDEAERSCSCKCGKQKMQLRAYENIVSITVNGQDLNKCEPNVVDYISKVWNFSMTRTYCPDFLNIRCLTTDVEGRHVYPDQKYKKHGKKREMKKSSESTTSSETTSETTSEKETSSEETSESE